MLYKNKQTKQKIAYIIEERKGAYKDIGVVVQLVVAAFSQYEKQNERENVSN
jgi:hypothetical protein